MAFLRDGLTLKPVRAGQDIGRDSASLVSVAGILSYSDDTLQVLSPHEQLFPSTTKQVAVSISPPPLS